MIGEQKCEDDRARKEFPRTKHFAVEHVIALVVILMLLLLLLLAFAGFVASYLLPDPYGFPQHDYFTFLLLLGSLLVSLYVLKNYWNQMRGMLLIASSAGLPLGIFLGSIFSLPYYLGLLLYFGAIGPFLALFSNGPIPVERNYKFLDVSLSMLAVLLSCALYALVAYFVTYRTRNVQQGVRGSFLAAFMCVLVATFTFTVLTMIPSDPTFFYQGVLTHLSSYQLLPLQTLPLSFAQAIHALAGGLIGSYAALRYLRKKNVSG